MESDTVDNSEVDSEVNRVSSEKNTEKENNENILWPNIKAFYEQQQNTIEKKYYKKCIFSMYIMQAKSKIHINISYFQF